MTKEMLFKEKEAGESGFWMRPICIKRKGEKVIVKIMKFLHCYNLKVILDCF